MFSRGARQKRNTDVYGTHSAGQNNQQDNGHHRKHHSQNFSRAGLQGYNILLKSKGRLIWLISNIGRAFLG